MGYDWVRLHASLNDLPAALILTGALLAFFNMFMPRESLRGASYWMIVLGWLGTIGAVIAGLEAEKTVAHGGNVHEMFERHETLGLLTLGVVTVAAGWRVFRERKMRRWEQSVVLVVTLVAAGLVYTTSQLGGTLVYDHGLGISTPVLREALDSRSAPHEHAPGESHSHDDGAGHAGAAGGDTAGGDTAGGDTAAQQTGGHSHPPGTAEHDH